MIIPSPLPEQLIQQIKEEVNIKEVLFVDDIRDLEGMITKDGIIHINQSGEISYENT